MPPRIVIAHHHAGSPYAVATLAALAMAAGVDVSPVLSPNPPKPPREVTYADLERIAVADARRARKAAKRLRDAGPAPV